MSKKKIPITAFNFISYCGKWLWARKDNDYFEVKIELLDKKRPGTVKATFVKYPVGGAPFERTYDIFYLLSSYEVWASLEEENKGNDEKN